MKVKINDGYQGPAKSDGTPSQPGDVVDVEASEGQTLIDSGIATKVAGTKKVATSKNKSVTTSDTK